MSGNVNLSAPDLNKIDSETTLGLEGVSNSLAYRIHEIERHLHGVERWYADGGGNTMVVTSLTPWTLTANVAANTYGAEVQFASANDVAAAEFPFTPVKFDARRILVTTASDSDETYMIQIWSGTGAFGAATLRTEIPYRTGTTFIDSQIVDGMMPRIAVDENLWARVKCTAGGATLAFIIGVHAYEG